MKTQFTMTDEDFAKLMEACKPTPAMFGSGGAPLFSTPQDNANRAWRELGEKMGFDWDTVTPCGADPKCFMAEPATATT